MPPTYINLLMKKYAKHHRLISYGGRFATPDKMLLARLCHILGVSKTAVVIRLRQLRYIDDKPLYEFVDPIDVIPD